MKRIIRDSVTGATNKPKNAVWVKDGQDMKWKIFKGTNSDTVDPDFLSLANKRNHANYIDVIVVPNGTHPNEVINSSSQNEYEYRKNIYLKRKHEFETLGEDDNNDVLSREEKMRIAKADMDKVAPKSVDSAAEYSDYKSDRRIGVTNQRYKGYMIRLDRAGYGYNVYDKNGELEDSGYPSKEAARNFIDELVSEADDEIESSVDIDEETEDPKWICLDIKHVRDSDGMLTDYALYTTEDEDKYICMFGDVDAYPPDEMYADAEFDSEEEALEWFEDYTGPGDEDEDEDYDVYHDDIDSAEELDEDEDDLDHPDQEFDSADTSINSTKLPAIYKMISIPKGSVGIDFGGGKWDNAIEHIRDLGATLCVYDPYNRSKAYNIETLKTLRANGGADWAVTSNVLNVIKEPSARKAVLENISKITKSGAPIYITVYEGRGDSKAGQTKSGYQLNRKTKDYIEEIQEVFPDATRKGKLIIAHNIRSASSSTVVTAASSGKLDKYMNVTKDRKKYAVHYTEVNTEQDAWTIYSDFRAQVSKIAPYDDADYAWADIRNGHIDVIRNGKVVKRSYYFNADDMDVENTEWCDIIIDEAIDLIAKINKDIEPRMVYNSTSVAARNRSSITSSADKTIRPIDELNDVTDQLRDDLIQKLVDVMSSPNFGFSRNEAIDYSRVDIRFDDDESRIEIEVGAEVDYDGLMQIAQELDPIIQSYDKAAYFDAEDAGLLIAYIPYESLRKRMKVNSASDLPEPSLDPPEYDDPEEVDEDVTVEFDMDRVRIDVDKSGSWEYVDDSFLDDVLTDDALYSEEYDVEVRDRNGLLEDLDDILKYDIPVEAGEYRISCHVTLVYHITGIEKYDEYPDDNYGDSSEYSTENAEVEFDFHDSYVEDFRIVD